MSADDKFSISIDVVTNASWNKKYVRAVIEWERPCELVGGRRPGFTADLVADRRAVTYGPPVLVDAAGQERAVSFAPAFADEKCND